MDGYIDTGPIKGTGVMMSDKPPAGEHQLEVTVPGDVDRFFVSEGPCGRLWLVPAALLNTVATKRLVPDDLGINGIKEAQAKRRSREALALPRSSVDDDLPF